MGAPTVYSAGAIVPTEEGILEAIRQTTNPPSTSGSDWELVGVVVVPSYQVQKTLINAEILHLPTAAITILEAQGEGIAILPTFATAILDAVAGGYTGAANASWNLLLNNHYMTGELCPSMGGGGAVILMQFPIPHMTGTNPDLLPDFDPDVVTNEAHILSEIVNQPLVIADTWDALPNYGGGNSANSLNISVIYRKLNTVTGIFV